MKVTRCRYLVMTTSGKPVFVYPNSNSNSNNNDDDDDDEMGTTRLCGLVQALRVSIQQTLDNQEIHCLQTSQSTRFVWMTIQSFTWMVIVPHNDNHLTELPIAFWKAQLERMYLAMIMMFTTQILDMLQRNPQLDVQTLWRDKQPEQLCHSWLEDDPSSSRRSLLLWGIPTCFLSSVSWRRDLASCLLQHDGSTPDPWMTLLLARTNDDDGNSHKLITYAASTSFPGFTTSDGTLFWNWLHHQLSLSLSTDAPSSSSSAAASSSTLNPKQQPPFPICFPHFHAAGYLYVSLHPIRADSSFTLVVLHQHEDTDSSPLVESFCNQTRQSLFWEEFRSSQFQEQWLWEEYLDLAQAWHFLFRIHHNSTLFTQCIVSPAGEEITNNNPDMWRMYHQLCWQLRLGSTGVESTLNHIARMNDKSALSSSLSLEKQHHSPSNNHPTVASDCPMLQCMSIPPSTQGVTYLTQGPTTYLAMSGRDFEL